MVNAFNQSLWGDEGFSAILSMKSLPDIIKTIANDTSPPLWNIFEWAIFNTLGTDEVYIRGLSFLFFLLTIFFVYLIGKHLFNKQTAILASLLTLLNPFFFTYAFEGRMYSILALGVTASMYFFLKRKWGGYIIATLWALYSHHFAIFALMIQGLWFVKEVLSKNKRVAKKMFKAFLFVGIGYIPWLIPLYNQTTKVSGGFWLSTPTISDIFTILADYLAKGIVSPLANIALILALGILIVRRWKKQPSKTMFLISWFLGPIILTWVISQVFQSIFFNRYLLYTIPAVSLILASSRRRVISGTLSVLLILCFIQIDYHYFTNPSKIPFKDLASFVKESRLEGDYLVNGDPGRHKLWETKYYGIPAPIYYPDGEGLPYFVGTALMEDADIINSLPNDINRLGVITERSFSELNLDTFTIEEEKDFGGIKFLWLQK